MPPPFVLQMFCAAFMTGCKGNLLSPFLPALNPVHSRPELFPCAHKGISRRFFLFETRGTSFWLMVVLAAAVWQSHRRNGAEWVVERVRKRGGAQESWTGYEGAEQHSQRLGDSLPVSSK